MTHGEALAALDKLDKYWSTPRKARQDYPELSVFRQCGCFGAHPARCLVAPWPLYADFVRGRQAYIDIARALGISQGHAMEIAMARTGLPGQSTSVFGSEDWPVQPNKAWPEISARLRELARCCT